MKHNLEAVKIIECGNEETLFGICHVCGSDSLGASSKGIFCRKCGFGVVSEKEGYIQPTVPDIEMEQCSHYLDEKGPYFDDKYYPHKIISKYHIYHPKIKPKNNNWTIGRFKDPKYELWREKIIHKYHNRCGKCGEIGTHCHHILNYSQFPSLRFKVKNGILFCKECHGEFHEKYGKKNNNRQQINEFLKMKEGGVHHSKNLCSL